MHLERDGHGIGTQAAIFVSTFRKRLQGSFKRLKKINDRRIPNAAEQWAGRFPRTLVLKSQTLTFE